MHPRQGSGPPARTGARRRSDKAIWSARRATPSSKGGLGPPSEAPALIPRNATHFFPLSLRGSVWSTPKACVQTQGSLQRGREHLHPPRGVLGPAPRASGTPRAAPGLHPAAPPRLGIMARAHGSHRGFVVERPVHSAIPARKGRSPALGARRAIVQDRRCKFAQSLRLSQKPARPTPGIPSGPSHCLALVAARGSPAMRAAFFLAAAWLQPPDPWAPAGRRASSSQGALGIESARK